MHPLHDHVAKQLADKLKTHRVVVVYDERSDFAPFFAEIRGGLRTGSEPVPVSFGDGSALLAEYDGSLLELRATVEPHFASDEPDAMVLYLPGCERDRRGSVLMELEKAGVCYEPKLKVLARDVLRKRYTDGVIDELLAPENVSYTDLARASSATSASEPPSLLKGIFHDTTGNDGLLAAWLVSDARDAEILAKQATRELAKLLRSRLGLGLAEDTALPKLRAVTLRYVLAGEFRSDLRCPSPPCLDGVPTPPSGEDEGALRDLARRLRTGFADVYATLADRVEDELGLRHAKLPAGSLGAIDTFRFEERALLAHCDDLIAQGQFDAALTVVAEREHSFWLDRDVTRKAHWEATRRMAELGRAAREVRAELAKKSGDASDWIDAFATKGGWHRLDLAQRRLEAWIANLTDDADERALGVVRRAYDDTCHAMAEGFSQVLAKGAWATSRGLHQTRIFSDVVTTQPKPVAYFLVDAMRFEMGAELAERLPRTAEVSLRHAVCALPSITTVGMAALLPGASQSFHVVEQGGKLGSRIDDAFLPDVVARKKLAAARVPDLVDLTLDELLSHSPAKLNKKVAGAQVVIVRSQEIDHAGENTSTRQARRIMDEVLGDLSSAMHRLAKAGIEHAVVSADHGHLFFATDRDDSMKTDAPGGQTIELHRRCWIGRGGTTPPGCVRVSAASLGYDSDLDFVFPTGSGVFKAGGDLAFHHGGPSLQELVIPVLTVRTKVRDAGRGAAVPLTTSGVPEAVTNRVFSVTLVLGAKQMMLGGSALEVRPLLVAAGKQVGSVGMAVGATVEGGCVTLEPNKPLTVVFLVSDDTVPSLRVVVQDPSSDAELYRSPGDIPVRLLS